MPKFLAVTSRGLIDPLSAELKELQFKRVTVKPDGVVVDASWAEIYRMHHLTRIASRVLLPVADFAAYNEDDLYFGTLRRHDFTQYIEPRQTFRVEAKVRDHMKLRDQRFVAMKVKDAVADQFRNKFGARPSVGAEESAALKVVVRVVGTKVSLAVDVTGHSLSDRGYRLRAGAAPLRENVAAALVRMSGWTPERLLVDPFCGSGTILIEAAMVAAGRPPLVRSRDFTYRHLKTFDSRQDFKAQGGTAPLKSPVSPRLFGFDSDGAAIEQARRNAKEAGVDRWISFEKRDMREVKAPGTEGVIITNPPYGERLEDVERAKKLMGDFSSVLKSQFKGWDAWILGGNKEAIAGLRLKAARRIPVWNGSIECRFLHYPLR